MKKITLQLGIILYSVLSTTAAHADSDRLFAEATEHYYQRFDYDSIIWGDAQLSCEAIGAHLATITSQAEENFIEQNLLDGIDGYFFIGGSDATSQTKWTWITGEKWGYKRWSTDGENGRQPNNGVDEDYLMMGSNISSPSIFGWSDIDSFSGQAGYICEWSLNKNIATAIVPDLNKNGKSEIALLSVNYINNQHTVYIKDMDVKAKKPVINILTFSTSAIPPKGLVVLNDLNGNKTPEIGVLFQWTSQPAVIVKDTNATAKTPIIKILAFLDANYMPQSVAVSPDSNGNGADEITVLGRHKDTLEVTAETRDSKTGKILSKIKF
jgi:hypothetical protein